jgi:hypothetical protein
MPITISPQDRLLLARRFRIEDPRALTNLSPQVPDDYRAAILEFEYDVKPADHRPGPPDKSTMLHCAHCPQVHWRGYVMKSPAGIRFLTGKDCGTKIYQLDFSRIEQEFRHQQARQYELDRLLRCLPLLKPVAASLVKLAEEPSYHHLIVAQDKFRWRMKELFQLLNAAVARSDDTLTIFETIVDQQGNKERSARNAEIAAQLATMTTTEKKRRRQSGTLPEMQDERKPMLRKQEKAVMKLSGITLFKKQAADVVKSISDCSRRALIMRNSLDNRHSHQLDNATLVEAGRKFQALVDQVREIQSDLADISAFFEPLHLRQVADWATNTPQAQGDYAASERILTFDPRGGYSNKDVVGLPSQFSLPDDDSAVRALAGELAASTIAAAA